MENKKGFARHNIKHDGLWSEEEATIKYQKQNIKHDGLWSDEAAEELSEQPYVWSDVEDHPQLWSESERTSGALWPVDDEPTSKYVKKNLRLDGLWSEDEPTIKYQKQNIKHDGLWSDEPEEHADKTLKYEKKNIRHDGLWSDEDFLVSRENEVDYLAEKKNLDQDGMWNDDEVAAMSDAEPEPAIELMEAESMVYVEQEDPENNNFWYFLGGAGAGLVTSWLLGGKTVEKIKYLPAEPKKVKYAKKQ